ncbi:hypothetical protein SDJN02_10019, partial [Cucurbita argyrosperma subsp. argyrosperma]
MGFFSFLGRVLFASIFILSAWQMFNEFSNNGGSAAAELSPKVAVLRRNLSSKLGVAIPDIDVTHLVAISLSLKGIGGLLFPPESFFRYPAQRFLAAHCTFWCSAVLLGDEEHSSKEATEKEGAENKNVLDL